MDALGNCVNYVTIAMYALGDRVNYSISAVPALGDPVNYVHSAMYASWNCPRSIGFSIFWP